MKNDPFENLFGWLKDKEQTAVQPCLFRPGDSIRLGASLKVKVSADEVIEIPAETVGEVVQVRGMFPRLRVKFVRWDKPSIVVWVGEEQVV